MVGLSKWDSERFTIAEAAMIARLPRKFVDRAVERAPFNPEMREVGKRKYRELSLVEVMYLKILHDASYEGGLRTNQSIKEALHAALRESWPNIEDKLKLTALLYIDTVAPAKVIEESILQLKEVRTMVVEDPEIRGGEPVFKGTRIPVHQVANERMAGISVGDLREEYPALNARQIELASVYAAAHPKEGRPHKKKPWHAISRR